MFIVVLISLNMNIISLLNCGSVDVWEFHATHIIESVCVFTG